MSFILDNPPAPGSPEWRRMISASKAPVIMGVSPYKSPFTLWHEMAGNLQPEDKHVPLWDWGHDLEPALAAYWLRSYEGWQLNSGEVAYTTEGLPFEPLATLDRRARRGRRFHIIECKKAKGLREWRRPDDPDESGQTARLDYVVQVTFQMGVSGIHEASIVAVDADVPEIHTVTWDPELWALIVDRCGQFDRSMLKGEPPELDDSVSTYDTLRGLHPDIDRDEDIQIDAGTATELLEALDMEAAHKAQATGLKSRILDQMGTARRAMVGDTPILTRTPGRGNTVTARINRKANL